MTTLSPIRKHLKSWKSRRIGMESTTVLFVTPGAVRGIARNIDLFGSLDSYNISPTPEMADALAIKSDVKAIADDFEFVLKGYSEEGRDGNES